MDAATCLDAFFMVKAFHFHPSEVCGTACSGNATGHSVSDGGASCPICNFVLSPFVEAVAFHVPHYLQLASVCIVPACASLSCENKLNVRFRAPPVCFY